MTVQVTYNDLSDATAFMNTFVQGGLIFPTPTYTYDIVSDGVKYTRPHTSASTGYYNINPTVILRGETLSVNSSGLLSGTVEEMVFSSSNRGIVLSITGLSANGSDFTQILLDRINGDRFAGNSLNEFVGSAIGTMQIPTGVFAQNKGFLEYLTLLELGDGNDGWTAPRPDKNGLTVDGGPGQDTLYLHNLGNTDPFIVNLAEGRVIAGDVSFQFVNFETIRGNQYVQEYIGSDGPDRISATQRDDLIRLNGGADWVLAGVGDDTVSGGQGHDEIYGGPGNDKLDGNNGNDTINAGDDEDLVTGGAGDDDLRGGDGDDRIFGGEGDDALIGGNGDDLLEGNDGNDNLAGSGGNDTLAGGAGDDIARGEAGDDFVLGGLGNDVLSGQAGRDRIEGGDGDDRISGGSESDTLRGNIGRDEIEGGGGDDAIFGGHDADALRGNTGNDRVFGEDGDDQLSGASGNDVLNGGAGMDFVRGGSGRDLIYGEGGDDGLLGDSGEDQIFGGDGNDIASGGAGNDKVYGNFGDDDLSGDAGNDQLFGGFGNDTLSGGGGNDGLFGQWGEDILIAGIGADTLSGGDTLGERDVFLFGQTAQGHGGFNRIVDFENGVDQLDISAFGFADFDTDVAVLASKRDGGAATALVLESGYVIHIDGLSLASFDASDVILS